MQHTNSPDEILTRLERWQKAQRTIMPMKEDEALTLLHEAEMGDAEISAKLDQLSPSSPRILASYTDLHALDRLGEAKDSIDLSANPRAGNVRAVLQAAEIAMLNTRDLTRRIEQDIEAGRIGSAEEKYRWVSSFQQTLHSLSQLAAKLPISGDGFRLSIADSPNSGACLDELKSLHRALTKAGLTEPEVISAHDLHEPGRNLTHQAFVDTTYTDLWMNGLSSVNVPGVKADAGEGSRELYKRFVGTDALDLAVNEVEQKGDNFLRQFRAYHQMSEILVGQANTLIADSIRIILSRDGNVLQAKDNMDTALAMLDIMNQNVLPVLRNLSVNKYQDIRGSLGITSGSHSPNIKQGLFSPLYELFTDAVKSRVMELKPYQEQELTARLQEIVADPTKDHATHDHYTLLKQANELHQALRTWRDLHMQFVKTQIGLPPRNATPTASISGSPSAVQAAHGMRHGAHGAYDVIIPVYETLLGRDFPAIAPFASVFREGRSPDNFVDTMLGNTARVVAERSKGVQSRVHGQ